MLLIYNTNFSALVCLPSKTTLYLYSTSEDLFVAGRRDWDEHINIGYFKPLKTIVSNKMLISLKAIQNVM